MLFRSLRLRRREIIGRSTLHAIIVRSVGMYRICSTKQNLCIASRGAVPQIYRRGVLLNKGNPCGKPQFPPRDGNWDIQWFSYKTRVLEWFSVMDSARVQTPYLLECPLKLLKWFLARISYILASYWQELVMHLSLSTLLVLASWRELSRNQFTFPHKYKSISQCYTQYTHYNTQYNTARKGKQNINHSLHSQHQLFKAFMSFCRIVTLLLLLITKVSSFTMAGSTSTLRPDTIVTQPVALDSSSTLTHLKMKIIKHSDPDLGW